MLAVPDSDFIAFDPGTDPLEHGGLRASESNGTSNLRMFVRLTGALPNATYHLVFVRFNDSGREDLADVTTDANGKFRGYVSLPLLGANRVGIFVLTRDGKDQFVSCAHS